ncbi:glycoside hydrolase family 43 protein [Marinoscillum sp. MHG1-6]|uniref:glycoside hydrolase family 43 protein n=1 Tax=Marinoscillum sp. MHG1-6 TaxID=2959627 RepID=UPI0021580E6C|nr:glycoside hydrolase family 43 protein [Marinoscillum sp. MHG1-6]
MSAKPEMEAYLMVYFSDDDHSLHMAISKDGYSFTALNDGKAVIIGDTIAEQRGIRDPHIFRGSNGSFYLAMTDLHIFAQREGFRDTEWQRDGDLFGWGNNRGFVLMKSDDLINWSVANVRVDQAFPGYEEIGCAWAPETTYDPETDQLMVYFTMRFGNGLNKLYYSYVNEEFNQLTTEPKLLFEYPKEVSYIDADITQVGDSYQMFYTPHDGVPGIKKAVSNKINEGYVYDDAWYDTEPRNCEAPNFWKRIGEEKWVLMYDIYGINPHNFGFRETSDFIHFEDLGHFNEGVMKATNFTSPKHGAVIHVTKQEATRLANHWGYQLY